MKKLKGIAIPGLRYTWSEIERREFGADILRLMECDEARITRLKIIDGDYNVLVRDAMEDELDEMERTHHEHERDDWMWGEGDY